MTKAKNKVIAGDYVDWDVICGAGKLDFMHRLSRVNLSRNSVLKYELIDESNSGSFWGAFLRGYFSHAILGTAGLLASSIGSAQRKILLLSIEFKNGKRSLIEVDEAHYKKILKVLY